MPMPLVHAFIFQNLYLQCVSYFTEIGVNPCDIVLRRSLLLEEAYILTLEHQHIQRKGNRE